MSKSVMNRRTMIKAMLGGGIGGIISGGCNEARSDGERVSACDVMRLCFAIREVESGNDNRKIGRAGEIGAYQIMEIYVDDVNRIIKIKKLPWPPYPYADRLVRASTQGMMQIYWDYYATPKRLSREPTLEDFSRIHNGGPDGWRNDAGWFMRNRSYSLERARRKIASTKKYWKKIEKELKGA